MDRAYREKAEAEPCADPGEDGAAGHRPGDCRHDAGEENQEKSPGKVRDLRAERVQHAGRRDAGKAYKRNGEDRILEVSFLFLPHGRLRPRLRLRYHLSMEHSYFTIVRRGCQNPRAAGRGPDIKQCTMTA